VLTGANERCKIFDEIRFEFHDGIRDDGPLVSTFDSGSGDPGSSPRVDTFSSSDLLKYEVFKSISVTHSGLTRLNTS